MRKFCDTCQKPYVIQVEKGSNYTPNVCSLSCFRKWIGQASSESKLGLAPAFIKSARECHERKSNYERAFESVLRDLSLSYLYEEYYIKLPYRNTELYYCPDFYLPQANIFFEVKGEWRDNAYTKVQTYRQVYDNLYVITYWFLTKILKKYPKKEIG